MKYFLFLTLAIQVFASYAQENANQYDVHVSTKAIDGRIQIDASYIVPVSICSAFGFITAYEGAKIFQEYWSQK